jgi:hypothetical protein
MRGARGRGLARAVLSLAVAVSAVSVSVFAIAISAGSAQGAVKGSLNARIVRNPIPRWTAVPHSTAQAMANYLAKLESTSIGPGGKAVVAADEWVDPADANDVFLILLVALSERHVSSLHVGAEAIAGARAAASSICAGAGTSPTKDVPVPSIPHSVFVSCTVAQGGIVPEVVAWGKANTLGVVIGGESVVPPLELIAVAQRQYAAMSTSVTSTSPPPAVHTGGPNRGLLIGIAGAVAVFVVLIGTMIFIGRRRKKAKAVAASSSSSISPGGAPAAGWYEDPADPARQRYWMGETWGPPAEGSIVTETETETATPTEIETLAPKEAPEGPTDITAEVPAPQL